MSSGLPALVARKQVLIADDHPVVRNGLRLAIDADPGFQVVAEANDGEDALTKIAEFCPDLAVLDLDMPKLDGFAVMKELKLRDVSVAIMILTIHSEEDLLQTAMELGAMGYVLKDQAMTEIVKGLRSIAEGKYYVSSSLTGFLLRRRSEADALERSIPGYSQLTATERQVLLLVSRDKSSKEIGQELRTHHRTVENHRNSICKKLGLHGSNALLRFAMGHRSQIRE